MSSINPHRLQEIAQQLKMLLTEHGISFNEFHLSILVPAEYFQFIKEEFPERHPSNRLLEYREPDWSIRFLQPRFPTEPKAAERQNTQDATTASRVISPNSNIVDATRLKEIANDVKHLLSAQGIEVRTFTLQVIVNKAYYEEIKANFVRHPIFDIGLGASEKDWSITIGHLGK